MNYPHFLRWTCPHCGIGSMTLPSGDRHLRRKHSDCWSCRLERTLLLAIMRGEGYAYEVKTGKVIFP